MTDVLLLDYRTDCADADPSILDDVLVKHMSVAMPSVAIHATVAEAINSRFRHQKRMMRVVVGVEALPAKREDIVEAVEPAVDAIEVRFVATPVQRHSQDTARVATSENRRNGRGASLRRQFEQFNDSNPVFRRHSLYSAAACPPDAFGYSTTA
jgi:hypothetical protein